MADYNTIIGQILKSEGYRKGISVGYVNDPDDRGGETIAGVSRRFWPSWRGWEIVDESKLKDNFPASLKDNAELFALVLKFYQTNFWNAIAGDDINNTEIAKLIADAAVLEGIVGAIKRAQRIVGMKETGKVNPELIKLLNILG